MAISGVSLQVIQAFLAGQEDTKTPIKLLSLSYPDLLVTEAFIAQVFGEDIAKKLRFIDDPMPILRWHNMQNRMDKVIDTKHFFELLNIDLLPVDIVPSRGCERTLDLNLPLPEDLVDQFDLVLDGGTIEHCFNIGQTMLNVAQSLKVGGFVIHANPLAMFNHGFYNLNPTFYADFYQQNGFQLISVSAVSGDVFDRQLTALPATQRFHNPPQNSSIMVVAEKTETVDLQWPMQTKYLVNPELRA